MTLAREEVIPESPVHAGVRQVGVRDLKTTTSEVIRYVREHQAPVEVTYRGQVVAKIVPVKGAALLEEERRVREERWQELSREISELWPPNVSAVDAIRDMRDDGCS